MATKKSQAPPQATWEEELEESRDGKCTAIRYELNHPRKRGTSSSSEIAASREELLRFKKEGFLFRSGILSKAELRGLKNAIDEVSELERDSDYREDCFQGLYLRHLIEKHELFEGLLRRRDLLSIANAMLGPQVKFDEIAARVLDTREASPSSPWHIHHRTIPRPMPPFFCYPHGINCLLYLDSTRTTGGPLAIVPTSHRQPFLAVPGHRSAWAGCTVLAPDAGDCILVHANLWHRNLAVGSRPGIRRLIILGYVPSWLGGEEKTRRRPEPRKEQELRLNEDSTVRGLAGEFWWD